LLGKELETPNGKPLMVLPCDNRNPVETVYQHHQVMVSGCDKKTIQETILPRIISKHGKIAEANFGLDTNKVLLTFQMRKSAQDAILSRCLITAEKSKVFFNAVRHPHRLTGLRLVTAAAPAIPREFPNRTKKPRKIQFTYK
jgi:hypothetical protein